MDNLIGLVNRIQRACTALGDHGGEGAVQSLWESLPSVVVVGGQVCEGRLTLLYLLFFIEQCHVLCIRALSQTKAGFMVVNAPCSVCIHYVRLDLQYIAADRVHYKNACIPAAMATHCKCRVDLLHAGIEATLSFSI
jgi:hypothetical protein